MVPIRRPPFLNGIRAFEAAARAGSFAGAGEELHVSPAAVSRIGAGLGTFLLPITIEKFGVSWTILGMAVIVFSGALVSQLWAPETKGMSLSETAHLYSH